MKRQYDKAAVDAIPHLDQRRILKALEKGRPRGVWSKPIVSVGFDGPTTLVVWCDGEDGELMGYRVELVGIMGWADTQRAQRQGGA